jgi:hypothetical protein
LGPLESQAVEAPAPRLPPRPKTRLRRRIDLRRSLANLFPARSPCRSMPAAPKAQLVSNVPETLRQTATACQKQSAPGRRPGAPQNRPDGAAGAVCRVRCGSAGRSGRECPSSP